MKLISLIVVALTLLATYAHAGVELSDEEMEIFRKAAKAKMIRVPIDGLMLVQEESEGELLLISTNGHYVIESPKIIDIWRKQEITSASELVESTKVDLSNFKIPPEDLNTIKVGKGGKAVDIFVDPLCEFCNKTLNDLHKYEKDYTFTIYITPLLGEKSVNIARSMACMTDDAMKFGILKSRKWEELPKEKPKDCDESSYQKTFVTARVIGVKAVPFIIPPNKHPSTGYKKDLGKYLKNNEG